MTAVVLLAALAGCAATDYVTEHGSVYECTLADGGVLELCTDLTAKELGDRLDAACETTSRLWPALTGCIYSCEPHRGCNATASCYCPEPL